MKLKVINKVFDIGMLKISKTMATVAAGILVIMMLLITGDSGGRYIFNKPIKGAQEFVELMMVGLVFLAMGYGTRLRRQIVVDLVISRLSNHTKSTLHIITSLMAAILFGLIVWQIGIQGWNEMLSPANRQLTFQFNIPEFPFYLLVALCCLVVCIELLIDVYKCLKASSQ